MPKVPKGQGLGSTGPFALFLSGKETAHGKTSGTWGLYQDAIAREAHIFCETLWLRIRFEAANSAL